MARRIFQLPDEMDADLKREAESVPYRTVSDFLREIIAAALKRAAAKTERTR